MVSGRSPKIIRFDQVPASLTGVFGKALEDDKAASYQTAREFRDALKTSVRTASVSVGPLVEGSCPSCGAANDAARKFCRGCGGSLVAPCLSCSETMAIWDEICGSCGAKQTPLLESSRAAMAARLAEAEGLLGDLHFDGARTIATELQAEGHPKLGHLREWAEGFLTKIDETRSREATRAAGLLQEAAKHEQAHDYQSAITALQGVPVSLHDERLPQSRETVAAALYRVERLQADAKRLEAVVRKRVAAKSFNGLLPEVEELLRLWPEREDLQRVAFQLIERHERLI